MRYEEGVTEIVVLVAEKLNGNVVQVKHISGRLIMVVRVNV